MMQDHIPGSAPIGLLHYATLDEMNGIYFNDY